MQVLYMEEAGDNAEIVGLDCVKKMITNEGKEIV
jgi:hypothetical protein